MSREKNEFLSGISWVVILDFNNSCLFMLAYIFLKICQGAHFYYEPARWRIFGPKIYSEKKIDFEKGQIFNFFPRNGQVTRFLKGARL